MTQKKSKYTVAGSIKIDPLASVSEFKVHGNWVIFTLNADLLHLISGSLQNELVLPLEVPIVIVDARDSTVLDSDSLIIYQSMRLMYGMSSLQASQELMKPLTCLALLQGDFKVTSSQPVWVSHQRFWSNVLMDLISICYAVRKASRSHSNGFGQNTVR